MSSDGKAKGASEENKNTEAASSCHDANYSKIASAVGVRILEGDQGELRHLTDTPPSVGVMILGDGRGGLADAPPLPSDAEDVSLLYSKVNKQKKTSKSEVSQDKKKLGITENSGCKEVPPSSPDQKSPSTMPVGGRSAKNGEICDRSEAEEPGGETTVESLASIDMIVSNMYDNLKTTEEGGGAGVATGMEKAAPGGGIDGEKMSGDVAKAESGCQSDPEAQAEDDNFYVNIDL